MTCQYTNPMTGKPTKMKGVTALVDEHVHRYESWTEGPDGKTFRNMEIVADPLENVQGRSLSIR